MKKYLLILITGLILLCMTGLAQATLVTIGTAELVTDEYGILTCNLIYDDDDTGHGGGGLVWLDYTNPSANWYAHMDWVSGIGASLTVNLSPGYTTSINWTTGWRLPDTVEGPLISGHVGDPDGDGYYDYTYGYNLANSEMGHLFYTELGNTGYTNTDGTTNTFPPGPDGFLRNAGDFDNLIPNIYWSNTSVTGWPAYAWYFQNCLGNQSSAPLNNAEYSYGIAVHSGEVSFNESAPVPEPATMLLFGTGLIGLAGARIRRKKKL